MWVGGGGVRTGAAGGGVITRLLPGVGGQPFGALLCDPEVEKSKTRRPNLGACTTIASWRHYDYVRNKNFFTMLLLHVG